MSDSVEHNQDRYSRVIVAIAALTKIKCISKTKHVKSLFAYSQAGAWE